MAITVFANTEVCVYGKEIRLARRSRRLSLNELAERMNKRGWVYYPSKLFRLENRKTFCLPGSEMSDLLACLGQDITVRNL